MTQTDDPTTPADPAPLSDYALPYLDTLIVFDDGLRLTAHADQRDMRRAQVAIGGNVEGDPIGFTRATAWAYLHRMGELSTGWKDFDQNVSFVVPLKEQTAADPTQTASDE
jgi:hypothetical protein